MGFLTLPELSALTGRTADTIRVHYLARPLREGKLVARFQDQPTHPDQANAATKAEPDAPGTHGIESEA
ncbi:MAG: hypothetical protein WCI05_19755 [Myxococcales bacterium]